MQIQAKAQTRRRVHWFSLVIAEYSICNLGNFAVMAILSLFLLRTLNLPAVQAGGLLLFTSLSFRLARIFLAPLVDRLPIRQATFLSLFLTSAGYLAMSFASAPLFLMAILLVVGVGHGTNSLLVKTMAAHSKRTGNAEKSGKSPFLRYASLTTGINVSAAVGSVVGSTLLFRSSTSSVFLLAATMYGIAGIVAMFLPQQELSQSERPRWGVALRLSLKLPALWRAMLFAFLGWFLYTQSYASLPLFVSAGVHRPELLGTVFALNAILVVVGQLPLSKMVMRLRLPTSQMVLFAFLSFASGFVLLWSFPLWQVVYLAVIFWTVGEMLLMPALDTLVAEGALFEHKQVAFTLNSAAVGLGEGIGNLVGVSLAGLLLKNGDIRSLYLLLAFGAIGATMVTIFVGNRRESMIHRLLEGQSLIATGQTDLLHPAQAPLTKGNITQTLLTWLSAPSFHEERNFLEAHPELLTLETGRLDELMEQHANQPDTAMLSYRLTLLRQTRNRMVDAIRASYVNMHGGLVLDAPAWLEEIKQQLSALCLQDRPDQTALARVALLLEAIKRVKSDRSIPAEILAELQVLYAMACMEAPMPNRAQTIEVAIGACEAVLQVYTLAQYPFQYARTQVFLSLAYQNRLNGQREENLERAIACYEAALQGCKSDLLSLQLAADQLTQNTVYAQHMIAEKQTSLEKAIACCQKALQDCIQSDLSKEWAANQRTHLLSSLSQEQEGETTLIRKRPMSVGGSGKAGNGKAIHIEWIAAQRTNPLKKS